MRGFFLEPNWFGLFLTFSLVGYVLTLKTLTRKSILLLLIVMVCSYLSGNRLSNYFVALTLFTFFFSKEAPRSVFVFVGFLGLLPVIYYLVSLGVFTGGDINVNDDRSLSARTITASRVIDYAMTSTAWHNFIFGHGLSSWASVALDNSLTIRSERLELGGAVRDTSETYVLFIEHGVFGCVLLLLDLLIFVKKAYEENRPLVSYALISAMFLLCSVFYYPIFFFMMYLIPYFLIRTYFVRIEGVHK